jgi:hypothetical protein
LVLKGEGHIEESSLFSGGVWGRRREGEEADGCRGEVVYFFELPSQVIGEGWLGA